MKIKISLCILFCFLLLGCSKEKEKVIILSHGSNPQGCKMEFYQTLKNEFEGKGYIVHTFDYTGFGEAAGPLDIDKAESYWWKDDLRLEIIRACLKYDVEEVILVGHSFGASPTLAVGIENARVAKIVCISPPRRMKELMDRDLGWLQERMKEDMGLEKLPPKAILWDIHKDIIMENFADYHFTKPLLFIDGSNEPGVDLWFMDNLIAGMSGSIYHIRIEGANHYFAGHEKELIKKILDFCVRVNYNETN